MSLVKELLPPGSPQTRYRIVVSGVLLILLFLTGAGYGLFEWIGLGGFARAEGTKAEIDSIQNDLKDIKLDLLEQTIYDTQRLKCSSSTAESESYYDGQLKRLHRKYFELTRGILLPIPACRQVGAA